MTRWKDKPFTLIGVNVNDFESKNLKERMAQEKMNWRSFAHQAEINAKWNPSTPGYYILDPKGVIRHKWVGAPGEKAIDMALEKLINEAEASGKRPPGAAGKARLRQIAVPLSTSGERPPEGRHYEPNRPRRDNSGVFPVE